MTYLSITGRSERRLQLATSLAILPWFACGLVLILSKWLYFGNGIKTLLEVNKAFQQYNPFNVDAGKLFHNGRFLRKTSSYHHEAIFAIESYFSNEGVYNLANACCQVSLYLTVLYYGFIIMLSKYMADKPAYSLKAPLFAWNVGLAVFSTFGAWRIGQEFFARLQIEGFTQTVCLLPNEFTPTTFWMIAFALSKIVEFGDTVFVVLRKKPLIFLHYYHHAVTLVYSFHSGAHVSSTGVFFAWMNYTVHTVMYAYYAVSALGVRLPKKLAMCITVLQTIQMFFGVGVSCYAFYLKAFTNHFCQVSLPNLYLAFFIYVTFAGLFLQFFYGAYVKRTKKVKKS